MVRVTHFNTLINIISYLAFFSLISCAGNPPEKTYTTRLMELDFEKGCVYYLDDLNHIAQKCWSARESCFKSYESDKCLNDLIVGIDLRDYINERNYQDVLKSSCESWR